MHPSTTTSACPHCGGTTGFMTNVTLKAVRLTAWNGQDSDTDRHELTSETSPKCGDCGKGVRNLFATTKPE